MFGHTYFSAGFYGSGFYGPAAGFHILAGSDLTTPAPALGASALVRGIVFPSALNFTLPAPAVGTAAFVQNFIFSPVGATAGLPTFAAGGLGQTHTLIKIDLASPAPSLGTSVFKISNILTASSTLATPAPVVGAGAIGQRHAVIATQTPVPPVLGVGILAQKQVFVAANILVPVPTITAGGFGAGRAFVAPSFVTPPAALAVGTLTQKQILAAAGITVAVPALGVSIPPLVTRALATGNLVMPAPIIALSTIGLTDVLSAVGLAVHAPVFGLPPEAEAIGPPLVWLHNRLKRWSSDPEADYYDEDGTENEGPVQEAIFSNLNDDIELEISPLTLVGRTSPERGPAESIEAVSPLYLWSGKLLIDIHQLAEDLAGIEMEATLPVLGGVAADINLLNDKILAETAARETAVTVESNARAAANTALVARVTALETRSYVDLGGVTVIALTSGFVYNVLADAGVVIINPATNISSGTFNLPTAPVGRQKIDFIAMKRVNTLTFATANGAHSLANPPTTITEGKCVTAVFGPALLTWLFIS